MASQVLSGSSNVSYTNNTGQNVRIVINYMRYGGTPPAGVSNQGILMTWAGVQVAATLSAIGRNLAVYNQGSVDTNNAAGFTSQPSPPVAFDALPTEIMLAPGQTFTAFCGQYNIVIIPEAG